jgi:hypothetical protein
MMMAGLRCSVAVSQVKPTTTAAALVITLEKKGADGVAVPMAADHVFSAGDTIRFRVVSQFDGYVYVMDQGTSGKFATLFPAGDTGSDNRVHKQQTLLVPATDDGWFEVANPAGFDVLYFLLSPEPIATPPAAAFVAPGPISSLRPKCNDAIFKARGECVDATAGPAAVPATVPLPAPLVPLAGAASRDIIVQKKKSGVTVSGEKTGPVLYTFRLAHK